MGLEAGEDGSWDDWAIVSGGLDLRVNRARAAAMNAREIVASPVNDCAVTLEDPTWMSPVTLPFMGG